VGQLTSTVRGKLVALDTAPLIYYLEEHPRYLALTDEIFNAIRDRRARALTSVLTLAEVLVKPLRDGRRDLANQYRRLLAATRGFTLCPVGENTCERAAELRAKYGWLRTPDALQVATALERAAPLIITNDDQWKRLTEIQTVVLSDYLEAAP
jgi:predicted nucleic acid-binding protein